jgi:hypothetical protein
MMNHTKGTDFMCIKYLCHENPEKRLLLFIKGEPIARSIFIFNATSIVIFFECTRGKSLPELRCAFSKFA